MEVIIENDPAENAQSFVFAAVRERADDDVAARMRCENGQPLDDRRSHEVGKLRGVDAIARPHPGDTMGKQSLGTRRKAKAAPCASRAKGFSERFAFIAP